MGADYVPPLAVFRANNVTSPATISVSHRIGCMRTSVPVVVRAENCYSFP